MSPTSPPPTYLGLAETAIQPFRACAVGYGVAMGTDGGPMLGDRTSRPMPIRIRTTAVAASAIGANRFVEGNLHPAVNGGRELAAGCATAARSARSWGGAL